MKTKRVLSMLLALVLVLGMLPVGAMAASVESLELFDDVGGCISGGVIALNAGDSVSISAEVIFADGTTSAAESIEWTVDDPSAVTVEGNGSRAVITGHAFGGAGVTATYTAEDGTTVSNTVYVVTVASLSLEIRNGETGDILTDRSVRMDVGTNLRLVLTA